MSLSSGDRDFMDGADEGYAQAKQEDQNRITRLESQVRELEAQRDEAGRRISTLESALVEIRDHPHCRYKAIPVSTGSFDYKTSMAEGHRCCAEIARGALEQK